MCKSILTVILIASLIGCMPAAGRAAQETYVAQLARFNALAARRRAKRADLTFPTRKKLIHNGWDIPSPAYLHRHLREMEKRPFDGTAIKLRGGGTVFTPTRWDETKFLEDYHHLAALDCTTFTDNFIRTYSASELDWFDEAQWDNVLHNTRIVAKAAVLGRCAGIMFDPECHGPQVWKYAAAKRRDAKSFPEYEARVKECGEQWIRALQEVCPRARILSMFLTGCDSLITDSDVSTDDDAPLTAADLEQAVEQMREQLPARTYALLPAFINGVLRGVDPDSMIINGNERAYYYKEQDDYAKYRVYARDVLPLVFIDPDLREKYARVVQTGFSFYVDYYYGDFQRTLSNHMSAKEQARWAEHNAYWALNSSDQYVWEWVEGTWTRRFDWWEGRLPPGHEAAILSARGKIAAGKPLGFTSDSLFDGLWARAREAIPSAKLQRLGETTPGPTIDGRLDDTAWKGSYRSSAFQPQQDWLENLEAKTTVRLCADSDALYVAFECDERRMPLIKKTCTVADDHRILQDDNVQILVASPGGEFPVRRFVVNAAGTRYDCLCRDTNWRTWDASYAPKWNCSTFIGDRSWGAEIAISWSALDCDGPPQGGALSLNFYRLRTPRRLGERSSWAPTIRWVASPLEPELFGNVAVE